MLGSSPSSEAQDVRSVTITAPARAVMYKPQLKGKSPQEAIRMARKAVNEDRWPSLPRPLPLRAEFPYTLLAKHLVKPLRRAAVACELLPVGVDVPFMGDIPDKEIYAVFHTDEEIRAKAPTHNYDEKTIRRVQECYLVLWRLAQHCIPTERRSLVHALGWMKVQSDDEHDHHVADMRVQFLRECADVIPQEEKELHQALEDKGEAIAQEMKPLDASMRMMTENYNESTAEIYREMKKETEATTPAFLGLISTPVKRRDDASAREALLDPKRVLMSLVETAAFGGSARDRCFSWLEIETERGAVIRAPAYGFSSAQGRRFNAVYTTLAEGYTRD